MTMALDMFWLEIAVVLLGLGLLAVESFFPPRNRKVLGYVALAGVMLVFLASFAVDRAVPESLERFYLADGMALFFKRLALVATALVMVMALEYRGILQRYLEGEKSEAGLGEFFSLPLFTCAGLMAMASAADLVSLLVSLELVTISFYVLVSFMRRNVGSLEAGVKYLILGALSTGFLVYGMAWLFGLTGETEFAAMRSISLESLGVGAEPALAVAFVLLFMALGFKMAIFPFHLWAPDVYQGAPTPITAFLSVGSKAASFVAFARIVPLFQSWFGEKLMLFLAAMAALTILFGNLAAIGQSNIKRLLAYSSVGHAGFLLLALSGRGASIQGLGAEQVVGFYLAAYLVTTMLAFLLICIVRQATGGEQIADWRGLSQRSPLMAAGMLVAMISLAGVPLTAGFVGKFLVLYLAVAQGYFWALGASLIAIGAGFYFYLKVVRAMYWEPPVDESSIALGWLSRGVIILLIVLIFVLGVYPIPLLNAF